MNGFNNVQHHLSVHHPEYHLEWGEDDEMVYVYCNDALVGVASSAVDGHKAVLIHAGLAAEGVDGFTIRDGIIFVEKGAGVSEPRLLPSVAALPVVREVKFSRTGVAIPGVVYDWVRGEAGEWGVSMSEFVFSCLNEFLGVEGVQLRAAELVGVRRGVGRREMISLFCGSGVRKELLSRVPVGGLTGAVLACLEEYRGEPWEH